jgi:hypothetical protein
MKLPRAAWPILLVLAAPVWGSRPDFLLHATPAAPAAQDAAIARVLPTIDASRIEKTINTWQGLGGAGFRACSHHPGNRR